LIFEFLRYCGPDDVRVVIVGQDPYPTNAQGVCFSTPKGVGVKPSLKNIFDNLVAHGLANRYDEHRATNGVCGDLRVWAAQGVVLINAALTTATNVRGAHRSAWRPFTQYLIRTLSAHAAAAGRRLVFMLWGGDARAYKSVVVGAHDVYEWTHPSPMSDNKLDERRRFKRAPHFVDANACLVAQGVRPIVWDPLVPTLAYTDGACTRNGLPDAVAAFAAIVTAGPLAGVGICGRVAPCAYKLVDANDLCAGFCPDTGDAMPPTNNRGEYLAWCWVLLILLRGRVCGRVEIRSDCNLFIKTITKWLPARRKSNTASDLKNLDLITIADALFKALTAQADDLALIHIPSHRPPPTEPVAFRHWDGNRRADDLATAAILVGVDVERIGDRVFRHLTR